MSVWSRKNQFPENSTKLTYLIWWDLKKIMVCWHNFFFSYSERRNYSTSFESKFIVLRWKLRNLKVETAWRKKRLWSDKKIVSFIKIANPVWVVTIESKGADFSKYSIPLIVSYSVYVLNLSIDITYVENFLLPYYICLKLISRGSWLLLFFEWSWFLYLYLDTHQKPIAIN